MADVPSRPGPFPRGIEVLVKKASVDPEFRASLLARRGDAAREIELTLEPAEVSLLKAVPAAQLEAIIDRVVVPPMTRAAFLGHAAAAMLAALAAAVPSAHAARFGGTAPDEPKEPGGKLTLYQERSYTGEVTCGVLTESAFKAKMAEVTRRNRALPKAYALAEKAWREDEAHKDTLFPMRVPEPIQCEGLGIYADLDKAEAARQRRQAQIDRQAEERRKADQAQLDAMTEAGREAELKRRKLLQAAQALFEEKLQALVAQPDPGPTPPVTRGTRPDRP